MVVSHQKLILTVMFTKLIGDKMKAPCKDCSERCLNCHSVCEEYFQYRREIMKASDAKYNDSNHKAYVSEACRRMKKRRNKH